MGQKGKALAGEQEDCVVENPIPSASLDVNEGSDATHHQDHTGTARSNGATPNIADRFKDLLAYLDNNRRRGMVSRIITGYYEGWRPSREEIADLVAVEVGVLRWEEQVARQQRRRIGRVPPSIIPLLGTYLYGATIRREDDRWA